MYRVEMKTYKPFSVIMRDHLTATDLLSVHLMKINSENVWIYKKIFMTVS